MGNCCKSSSTSDCRNPLNKPDAPEGAVPTGAYATAGTKDSSSKGKKPEGFLDWGDNPPGGSADKAALQWLNFLVAEVFPYADEAIHKLVKEQIEPQLKEQVPSALKGLHFSKLSLGKNVPEVGPIHVHKSYKQRQPGIEVDVTLFWDCDADILLNVMAGVSFGIKRLRIKGKMCFVMRPLMKSMPIVGGVQIFMLQAPQIDWDFTGVGQFADFPCVSTSLRKVVRNIINDKLVLPHRVFIHWVNGRENEVDITSMQFPIPEGLLRLCVVEARGLDGKDWNLFQKSTSDPYALVHVGAREFRTPTKKKTCDPKWNDEGCADFYIFSQFQDVSIELFDDDFAPGGDDFLGRVNDITIRDVVQKGTAWYSVTSSANEDEEGHPAGEVCLSMLAFEFEPDIALVRGSSPQKKGKADTKALLHVQVRALRGLPADKAAGVVVQLRVGDQTFHSVESTFFEAKQDFVFDQNTVAIDPAAQRMAEFLSTKDKLPVDQIAQIAGLDKTSLSKVLRERPSFTTRWNQGFNILLNDVQSATVEIELQRPGAGAALLGVATGACAVLEQPYQVKELLKEENVGMTWEGFLDMKPPIAAKPTGQTLLEATHINDVKNGLKNFAAKRGYSADAEKLESSETSNGPLDLDISFSLFGLRQVRTGK